MKARLLVITDLHKRYSDMKSIRNILPVQHQIQEDIITFNKSAGITHNIVTGDWYDRGFHGLGQAYSAMEEDRRISASVNGNVYLCLGNHFYLERDENPEMYIIQPNDYVKPRDLLQLADRPVFNLVPTLKIGTVQISFFHFNKVTKNYIATRDTDTTFHIGIYHDDRCVPGWVREREGFGGVSSSTELSSIYDNIDLAIHGHIHSNIGLFNLELASGKKVPIWIPGALGMTQDKEAIKHTDVDLPVIEIGDDNAVQVKSAKFYTHLDQLKFYGTTSKKKSPMAICDIPNKVTPEFRAVSMHGYLQRFGFSDTQLRLAEEAVSGISLQEAARIIFGG